MSLQSSIASLREDRASYSNELKIPSQAVPMTFVHGAEVRVALGGSDRPMLLLPVSSEDLRQKLPDTDGLAMEFAQYKGAKSPTGYFLQVSNAEDSLEGVFLDLVENICSRIRMGEGSYFALVRAIEEFRHLLSKSRAPIDRTRIIGLFGELLFLRRVLESNPSAVEYWTGPQGARRDFLFPGAAFEVKASEQSTGRRIVIHSLAQLDSDDSDNLCVVFYRLEDSPGKGLKVGELVADIRSLLASCELFEEKLNAVGFDSRTEQAWNCISWTLLEEKLYKVEEGFPRIIASSFFSGVPVGVSGVNYQVDLDVADDYSVSFELLGSWLKK